jgi:hypothetical protein
MMMMTAGSYKYLAEMHKKMHEEAKANEDAPLAKHHKKASDRCMKKYEEWNKNPHARGKTHDVKVNAGPQQSQVDDEDGVLESYINQIWEEGEDFTQDLWNEIDAADWDAFFDWVPKPAKDELDDWIEGMEFFYEDEKQAERYRSGKFSKQEDSDLLERYYQSKYESERFHRVTVHEISGRGERSIWFAWLSTAYDGTDSTVHRTEVPPFEWTGS